MKISDFLAIIFSLLLAAFFIYEPTRALYAIAYESFPLVVSFAKFAILATCGEMLVFRLKKGIYVNREFGLIPKMLIWGILGVLIYFAFGIFSKGVTALFNVKEIPVLNAFLISLFMNIIFAPLMMLTHHITDMHISNCSGKFLFSNLSILDLLKNIDWDKMWSFVFKKTIPLFWIPAHTVTFLLPTQFRTLFAALLSIVLGLLLALSKEKKKQ